MIVRIQNDPYVNVIELAWIFIKREFFTTMEFLQFYDQEDRSWNVRAVWWYIIALAIMSVFLCGFTHFIPAILFWAIVTGTFTRFLEVSKWR